jgi:hypothetical protein
MAKSNPSSAATATNKSNDGDSSSVASSSNDAAITAAAVMDDGGRGDSNQDDDNNNDDDYGGSVYGWAWIGACAYAIYRIIYYAYRIRMAAIDEYGPVIHEFDPYFNYRATEVRKERRVKTKVKSNQVK